MITGIHLRHLQYRSYLTRYYDLIDLFASLKETLEKCSVATAGYVQCLDDINFGLPELGAKPAEAMDGRMGDLIMVCA